MALTQSTQPALGTPVPDFALPAPDGTRYSRDDLMGQAGLLVMVICNHCPFVKALKPALAAHARTYMDQGVGVVAINGNDVDSHPDDAPDRMAEDAERFDYPFPYLFDADQHVLRALGAACTPDFFLYDASGKLFYRGQFDASRPGNNIAPDGAHMDQAVKALVAGAPPPSRQIPCIGCNVKWRPGTAVQ
ncbi:thioredoxin family protein [Yunchengibacter salinarum]|uniref:thioredoxin family protein n=1 Tax=Yunchengibacter salinarum TaxID=3133399 RepID=UPI0035B5EF15